MRWKKNTIKTRETTRKSKRGSILVEASIILPIFIIAVCTIISIIPIVGTCEKAVFAFADEIHMVNAKAAISPVQLSFPSRLENRIEESNKNISEVNVKDFWYKFNGTMTDDLISAKVEMNFQEKNPLGIFNSVNFKIKILSRGFTGSYRTNPPMERQELESVERSNPVIIFPNWGEKYHNKSCWYVKNSYKMKNWYYIEIQKDDAVAKGYTPCLKCGGD